MYNVKQYILIQNIEYIKNEIPIKKICVKIILKKIIFVLLKLFQ